MRNSKVFDYLGATALKRTRQIRGAASVLAAASFLGSVAHAQVSTPVVPDPAPEQRRQQERERAARQREERRVDVLPGAAAPIAPARLPQGETPCFEIKQIVLNGDEAQQFEWALGALNGAANDDSPIGKCIGAQGISVLLKRVQDAMVAKGFVTSRILAQPQDLKTGNLVLTVIPGRIRNIRFAPGTIERATAWNAMPAKSGDILNLRDIEQGLENFKRVPTAEVDIKIEPADGADAKPGYSDLVISYTQAFPYRLSLWADDSGTKGTGKFQSGITVSYDNWLTLNDLFYVTFTHDLGGGQARPRGTQAQTVHYSIPYGYWTLAATVSDSRYHQTVAGATQDFDYSGTSQNAEVKLSRLIYRDASRKTTFAVRAFQRKSNNFIDDTEVQVQRRVVGGWEGSASHREFLGQATVDANMAYKRGTGAFGSLAAPEEAFGEGTSRFALITADINLNVPFKVGEQTVKYNSLWRMQSNRTPLTPQDRFAIGGRYTVRGFDGESSLSLDRGWLLRNDLAAPLGQSGQEVYAGLDYGRVAGRSSADLVGTQLAGAVLGVRGRFKNLQYDVFVGTPVLKPEGFRTASTTAGFTLNINF
jgi:hemolysin activation/secretion protein